MKFFQFLTDNMFIFDMLLIAVALCVRFPRRRLFWLRLIISVPVCVVAAYFLPRLVTIGGAVGNIIWFVFDFALIVGVIAVCLRLRLWKVFFVASSCYFVQNGAFCFDRVIRGAVPITVGNYFAHYGFIALFLIAIWLIYWRKVTSEALDSVNWVDAVALMFIAIAVCICVSSFSGYINTEGMRVFYAALLSCVLISLCCQYAILRVSILTGDKKRLEELIEYSAKQYAVSKENIENLNIKCHDLKYKIAEFEREGTVGRAALDEMKTLIAKYDCTVHTGNPELDIVLTEKSLACRNKGVEFTCIADGARLVPMETGDLYAFFGNAMDNAIEAAEKLDDDKKFISLTVAAAGGMVTVNLQNYTSGRVNMRGGVPQTSKDDKYSHGFGTLSMKLIAQKYGGEVSFVQDGDVFNVNAVFPCRSAQSAQSASTQAMQ